MCARALCKERTIAYALLAARYPSRSPRLHPWPDFFIVGAPRCGTSSLYQYLRQCPQVFLPRIKEPLFFNTLLDREKRFTDLASYLALFADAKPYQKVGEASPTYLHDPGAPLRIAEANPDAKVVMILRDPVARTHSHYLLEVRFGVEHRSFGQAIREVAPLIPGGLNAYVDHSVYADALNRYLKAFPRENVLILWFEDFVRNPDVAVTNVLEFLGCEPGLDAGITLDEAFMGYRRPRFAPLRTLLRRMVRLPMPGGKDIRSFLLPLIVSNLGLNLDERIFSSAGKKPPIADADEAFLREHFASDLQSLQALTGRDLSNWLRLGAAMSAQTS